MPLSKAQKEVFTSEARFRVLITGRRFGKTYLAINELAKFASKSKQKETIWDEIKQTMTRNEANFVSWDIDYINNEYTDGTGSFSVDASGNKLTYTTSTGLEFIYTKVNDTFPGTDCKN